MSQGDAHARLPAQGPAARAGASGGRQLVDSALDTGAWLGPLVCSADQACVLFLVQGPQYLAAERGSPWVWWVSRSSVDAQKKQLKGATGR